MPQPTPRPRLGPRHDPALPDRLAASAASRDPAGTAAFDAWLLDRAAAHAFEVRRIPFAGLRGWRFVPGSGDLVHESGRFFSVEGLRWRRPDGSPPCHQPIIDQPEVGILGIVMRDVGGVPHFLMQAKMEPGNPRPVMLSPTVQATRSNYTGVHGGTPVRYLEYFVGPRRGRVVADVLQSEHGDWFRRKRNRNMIVEIDRDVPPHPDFRWLTLGDLHRLLARDNVVNMDSRTVLACLPPAAPAPVDADPFRRALAASRDPAAGALCSTPELLGWLTGLRADEPLTTARVPLAGLPGWHRDARRIGRDDGRHFQVVAVAVRAGNREVTGWTQPLFEPVGTGLSAFLVREFDGVLHVLVRGYAEGGFLDTVELGPTVQAMSPAQLEDERPPFLDQIPAGPSPRVRYSALQAEEGGRFLDAVSRYLVVEADDRVPDLPPPGYAWVTTGQLSDLVRLGLTVNVQARTLVAALNSLG